MLIVDNTFATPALQQPILLGADLVLHWRPNPFGGMEILSPVSYAGPKNIVENIRRNGLRYLTGATIAPLTAFLLLRGLKTLELRMEPGIARRRSPSPSCSSGIPLSPGFPIPDWRARRYTGSRGAR